MSQFAAANDHAKQGRARMCEIAVETQAGIERTAASLLACLGRPPTVVDELEAEAIGALYVKARRLRACGRDDSEVVRMAATLLRGSGFCQARRLEPAA
jgi:hypothetical protein